MPHRLGFFLLVLALAPLDALAQSPPVHRYNLPGFNRVTQMARRADGRIYIADAFSHRIKIYSPDGIYLEQIGSLGTALGQFNLATGIAFDADGNLYVVEQTNHRVTKLSPTHLPLMTFGSSGSGPGQLAAPTNLAVSPDGSRLYVTEFLNARVSMFDTGGQFLGSFGSPGQGPGQFDHPFGIAVNGAGEVYVADQGNHRVQRFDAAGTYLGEWGAPGSDLGQFQSPVGLGIDDAGNVYVTDQLNNRVQKFGPTGTPLVAWGTLGTGAGQMNNPWAVLPLSNGEIWVGDTNNFRVSVYGPAPSPAGAGTHNPLADGLAGALSSGGDFPAAASGGCEPVPEFVRNLPTAAHGGFDRVTQMVRRADGRIYVADAYHHRVIVYSEDGLYLEQIGSQGTALGQFNLATGIAFDADDNLFVAEQTGNRVTKLSPTHLPLMTFDGIESGPGQLGAPTNLAISPDGSRLYVTELVNARVSMFDADGQFLGSFGSLGQAPGQFDDPFGIAVNAAGEVYVADQSNHRVQWFDAAGTYLGEWGGAGSALGQFQSPVGLGIDDAGSVYVTDQLNNRVQKFGPTGAPRVAWGTLGTGPGQMYNPWAVLLLPDGEIWVGDTYNHRVSVYGPGTSSPAPTILSITDVPEDDGLQVRIRVGRSGLDVPGSPTPITQYEVFRRIDATAPGSSGAPPALEAIGAPGGMTPNLAGWDFVGAMPAHAETEYNMVVPTLIDSRMTRPHLTVFFVRAATAQPTLFHDSCPDSGESWDNHPPGRPNRFAVVGATAEGAILLDWDPNEEPDFDHYRLHRGASPDFVPDDSNKLADVVADQYTDPTPPAGWVYYKLLAQDRNDNASDPAVASTAELMDVTDAIPKAFALHAIQPNPAGERAIIAFDLPVRSSVTLRVMDVTGRLVQQLASEVPMAPGRHQWRWDRPRLAKGVYYVQLRCAVFTATRSLVVMD